MGKLLALTLTIVCVSMMVPGYMSALSTVCNLPDGTGRTNHQVF